MSFRSKGLLVQATFGVCSVSAPARQLGTVSQPTREKTDKHQPVLSTHSWLTPTDYRRNCGKGVSFLPQRESSKMAHGPSKETLKVNSTNTRWHLIKGQCWWFMFILNKLLLFACDTVKQKSSNWKNKVSFSNLEFRKKNYWTNSVWNYFPVDSTSGV